MVKDYCKNIVISLGSNLGGREASLENAKNLLREEGIRIVQTSEILETKPIDYTDQSDFLNQVLVVETEKSPEELLHTCLEIEQKMGRTREIPKGPRNIDIDLLFYRDEIRQTPELTLPHPEINNRPFLLKLLKNVGIIPILDIHYGDDQ